MLSSLALGHSGPPQTIFRAEDVIRTQKASAPVQIIRTVEILHPPTWSSDIATFLILGLSGMVNASCLLAPRIQKILQEEKQKADRNKLEL